MERQMVHEKDADADFWLESLLGRSSLRPHLWHVAIGSTCVADTFFFTTKNGAPAMFCVSCGLIVIIDSVGQFSFAVITEAELSSPSVGLTVALGAAATIGTFLFPCFSVNL